MFHGVETDPERVVDFDAFWKLVVDNGRPDGGVAQSYCPFLQCPKIEQRGCERGLLCERGMDRAEERASSRAAFASTQKGVVAHPEHRLSEF